MPITAKFSKAFYDKLGHGIADEMVDWFNQADAVYRTQLRELNDLNYARFEAKVDQRFDEIWIRARLSALIRYALRFFPPRDLRCYFLVEVHHRPIAQVAERLGMSVSAVYNRRRAVARQSMCL